MKGKDKINWTDAMKKDNITRIIGMFISAILVLLPTVSTIVSLIRDARTHSDLIEFTIAGMIAFIMMGSVPIGLIHLFPRFPKYSTLSRRKKFFRSANKVTKILLCIPFIGWTVLMCEAAIVYIAIPMYFGFFAGPVYLVMDLIRFIKKQPLIYDYEIPKYYECPPCVVVANTNPVA